MKGVNNGDWIVLGCLALFHIITSILLIVLAMYPLSGHDSSAKMGVVIWRFPVPLVIYLFFGYLGLVAAAIVGLVKGFLN